MGSIGWSSHYRPKNISISSLYKSKKNRKEKKSKKSKNQRKSPRNPKEKNERKPFVPDKNFLADIHIKNRSSRIKTLL